MAREAIIEEWKQRVDVPELATELEQMMTPGHEEALEDAFFQDLAFGTAGLRGVIGCGTNRMNFYTVGKATQGFAEHLTNTVNEGRKPRVAIARDSRHKGREFVERSASVLAANGVEVFIYPRIAATPALSFAVRYLECDGGICMTASHNPAAYNGYKVYNNHGCQITSETAEDISRRIEACNAFEDVKSMDFEAALEQGLIHWIDDAVVDAFIEAVMRCSVADASAQASQFKIVYTPLNGTGLECCERIMRQAGFNDVVLVDSQKDPDGDFPTCPYPNPEDRAALAEALKTAEEVKADIVLATDPDADRIGVAVAHDGHYELLTGNEIGILLMDYLCRMRTSLDTMPQDPVAVSTIVSTQMIDPIAAEYGVEVRRVLTGFKYIGDIITELEAVGQDERFILGFEESYGYLTGAHVRDKDAVNAALLVCQMAQHHVSQGDDLSEAIEALYQKYGYYANRTLNIQFPGADGAQKMNGFLKDLRAQAPREFAGLAVQDSLDYLPGLDGLPAANVLEYRLGDGIKVIFRPSGTEPKLKAYLFTKAASRDEAHKLLDALEADVKAVIGS